MNSLFFLLVFLQIVTFGSTLYFHMGETEKKCFIEEIPDETMITGVYKITLFILKILFYF